ncbi:MAG TPA: thiamine pyrophosphate-dependent dehydrogenase E1 component subunit alpha [Terriglobia bacterium]|nr:thiamine pyrophosphate-dependent dehydrogenase E1 component subunit alpha [Terriglobia bacterium]
MTKTKRGAVQSIQEKNAERPSKDLILSLYRTMVEIREFELKARELFRSGKMPGFIHLYIGEEAVASGVIAHLKKDDYVTSTHRGHGHALAKGISAREAMAELMGKEGGCCGGRGGSMHLYEPAVGFLGTNGVVPPGIPIAAGAALSAKLRKSGQVTVCFFGDGAVNNASFHEGLNMAAAWELPVVYVCENNLYATEMPFQKATKNISVASRAAAYSMPGEQVDGNNVLAVYERAGKAIDRARRGEGPTLIECLTYRWFGHHEGDPGTSYRSKEEIEAWKERDPIKKLREETLASQWCEVTDLEKIEKEIQQLIEEAAQFSLDSPQPGVGTVLDHVFCNEQRG